MKHFKMLATLALLSFLGQTAIASQKNIVTINTDSGDVTLREEFLPDNGLKRTYERAGKLLFQSQVSALENGLKVETSAGHVSQLGYYELDKGILRVVDQEGELIWSEQLEEPLCPTELAAEFVRAHWDRLAKEGDTVRCGIPIIKAKKVAPVKWVRLEETDKGEQAVVLRAGSFGMLFFLTATRLTFDETGTEWRSQRGQFESTSNPDDSPSYLKGEAFLSEGRDIAIWEDRHFGYGYLSE